MSSFAKSRTSKNGLRNRPSRQVKTQDAEPVVQVCWRGLVDTAFLARQHFQTPSAQIRNAKFHGAIILTQMASVLQIAPPDAIRRIQRVQTVTIAWMSVEAAVSLFAAWRARSPALLAFGGDSAIELFSAIVVLWRFGEVMHTRTWKNGLLVSPEPCYSHWLSSLPSLRSRAFWAIANPTQRFWGLQF